MRDWADVILESTSIDNNVVCFLYTQLCFSLFIFGITRWFFWIHQASTYKYSDIAKSLNAKVVLLYRSIFWSASIQQKG